MRVTIEIENCQGCPFGWSHTNHAGEATVVCDKLQDNVGVGGVVFEGCPLVVETEGVR
jgi:hypothetical protein